MLSERKVMPKFRSAKSAQQGVVLIEAMLAIVIFSIGVLAVVGLQAAMIKNADESKYRAEASYIAQKRIGEMWADPVNVASYVETDTPVTGLLPNGKRTVVQTVAGQYQVTVKWTRPGATSTEHNFTTTAFIAGN
jgi:type IV pilus assembly protein PilV